MPVCHIYRRRSRHRDFASLYSRFFTPRHEATGHIRLRELVCCRPYPKAWWSHGPKEGHGTYATPAEVRIDRRRQRRAPAFWIPAKIGDRIHREDVEVESATPSSKRGSILTTSSRRYGAESLLVMRVGTRARPHVMLDYERVGRSPPASLAAAVAGWSMIPPTSPQNSPAGVRVVLRQCLGAAQGGAWGSRQGLHRH